ncbi:MAG: Asp-tRNA(Asn)/Glu-tRNA(Gln) amidotransferase subunit GatC [Bdellovibrionales bacterium]|nr:Asp-tRNA(Asn)/Glu-tRNA(Gln) amidotransferase subunit GatC [Bdellovibrionales bacterium]
MSNVDSQLIEKLAKLSRVALEEAEVQEITKSLSSIFEYVEQLNAVNIAGVEPLRHVFGESNCFRDDTVDAYCDRDKILSLVPERSGSLIRVPLVIDQE